MPQGERLIYPYGKVDDSERYSGYRRGTKSYWNQLLVSCAWPKKQWILTKGLADVRHRFEDSIGEVDFHLHVLHVGKLKPEQLVLRSELQFCICLYSILVQSPVSFKKPRLLLLPPQGVVRPILLDICKRKDKRLGIRLMGKLHLTSYLARI